MLCHHWLVGPLFGRCFAAESVLAHFLADALPPWSLGSLADAFATVAAGCSFSQLGLLRRNHYVVVLLQAQL
jgi:hypothetical protein